MDISISFYQIQWKPRSGIYLHPRADVLRNMGNIITDAGEKPGFKGVQVRQPPYDFPHKVNFGY